MPITDAQRRQVQIQTTRTGVRAIWLNAS